MPRRSNKIARGMWQSATGPVAFTPRPKPSVTIQALMAWVDEAASFQAQGVNKSSFRVRDSVSNRMLATVAIDGTNLKVIAQADGESSGLSLYWAMNHSDRVTKTDIPLSDPDLRIRMMRAINGAYT